MGILSLHGQGIDDITIGPQCHRFHEIMKTQDIHRICMEVVAWVVLTEMILGKRVEPAGSVFAILNPNDL